MRLTTRSITLAAMAAMSALMTPLAAHAQLVISNITQQTPIIAGTGGESYYTATLTNSSSTDQISLDSIFFTFNTPGDSYLTGDDAPFFDPSFPAITLDPGQSISDVELFGVIASASAPEGGYLGTVNISGLTMDSGTGSTTGNYSTPQDFGITISTVAPEPSTLPLIATGLFAASMMGIRRMRRRA